MTEKKARVSIVILNWNGLEDTIKCLNSLKKNDYSNYEVVLVDNGSSNNEADILKKRYGDYIRLIKNEKNLGFAEGNNVAIRKILKEKKSKYILTLNNDTLVAPYFLEELIQCAEKDEKIGSVQPKMILARNPKYLDSVGLILSKTSFGFNRGAYKSPGSYSDKEEILGACAGAALYRFKAVKDILIDDDFFDKDFFAYYEDFDVAIRLRWGGWKNVFCPKAKIFHKRGASGGTKSKFTTYYGSRNQVWNFLKNFPNDYILKNSFLILMGYLGQFFINLFRGNFLLLWPILKGKIDAFEKIKKMLAKKKKIKKRVSFANIKQWIVLKWKINIPKEIKI